jgi:hypothetical protein
MSEGLSWFWSLTFRKVKGDEMNIWTQEGRNNRRLEKTGNAYRILVGKAEGKETTKKTLT